MKNKKIFNIFEKSGLHQRPFQYIRTVFSIVLFRTMKGDDQRMIRNSKSDHSEERVIAFLTHLLDCQNLPSQTIKIYINFSPCPSCSKCLGSFLQIAKTTYGIDLKLEIVFPFLYNIRRPSCAQRHHKHNLPSADRHKKALAGLHALRRDGAILRTFQREDWLRIAEYLNVSYRYEETLRQKEDQVLLEDFNIL